MQFLCCWCFWVCLNFQDFVFFFAGFYLCCVHCIDSVLLIVKTWFFWHLWVVDWAVWVKAHFYSFFVVDAFFVLILKILCSFLWVCIFLHCGSPVVLIVKTCFSCFDISGSTLFSLYIILYTCLHSGSNARPLII